MINKENLPNAASTFVSRGLTSLTYAWSHMSGERGKRSQAMTLGVALPVVGLIVLAATKHTSSYKRFKKETKRRGIFYQVNCVVD